MPEHTAGQPTGTEVFPRPRDGACPFDPPPEYNRWRAADPIKRVVTEFGSTTWLFTGYEEARAVLGNRTISSQRGRTDLPFPKQGGPLDLPPLNTTFVSMDAPEHSRIRRLLAKHFMAKRVDTMRPRIQRLVDEQIDHLVGLGSPVDLVDEFALPLPSMVTCWMLGVPSSEHAFFQERTSILVRTSSEQEKQAALLDLLALLTEVAKDKMRQPADDIISRFLQLVPTGEMSLEDVVANATLVLIAGHESTANQIALGTLALLRHPEQLRLLRDRPELVENGVEEVLRYTTVAQIGVDRVATDDFEVGGELIRRGDGILVSLPAADRDERQFPDPDTLDVTRPNARRHVAFGAGPHQCVGNAVARAELQSALPTLLRRLPDLRLAVPFEEIDFKHESFFYGVRHLPIAW